MPVKTVTLQFSLSGSNDVVGYNMYMCEAPATVDYTCEKFDLGNSNNIDLSTLPGITTKDGIYNLGITAVDNAGNESSMNTILNVALDFVAPDPPGAITIIRS